MKLYKEIAKTYKINPKALKRKMKEEGVSTSEIHPLEIMNVIFVYAPTLMYSREGDFEDTVEFADADTKYLFLKTYSDLNRLKI